MIENKVELFKQGVMIFCTQVIRGDRDAYVKLMVHDGGYIAAAKQFYLKSGYLKQEEVDALFDRGEVPKWMGNAFMEIELAFFHQTLWDKQ